MPEHVDFEGVRYYRYPGSPNPAHRSYFHAGAGAKGTSVLHRAIWMSANGPIPDGFQIHHIDGDSLNNDLSNLECVNPKTHAERHRDVREKIELTCEWCGSDYKCATRRGNERFCSAKCLSAERRASGIDDEDRICEFCGGPFRVNRYEGVRFCTRSCGQRNRRGHKPPQ